MRSLLDRSKRSVAKRHIMKYNYDIYNKFLLIDPNRDENDPDKVDLGEFVP